MPKISVIIPVYNVEKYIEECLESIVNQTFTDTEIICVDDCGTDASMSVVERYAQQDGRIKILHHEKNKGLGAARNTGMDEANGEYIFFLDSDDYALPDTLKNLYEKAIQTKSDITVVHVEAFADDDSEETKNRVTESNKWLDKIVQDNYKVTPDNYQKSISDLTCLAWGKLYKKDFIENNHLRFIEQKVMHEDNGFWLKVCACFPDITYIDYLGVMYRMRQGAITDVINKRKQHNKKKNHLRLNLEDAFLYFDTYKKEYAESLKTQIKMSEFYRPFFDKKIGILFRYRWTDEDKRVIILGVPLYRAKISKDNKKIIRILGIPVYSNKIE